MKTFTKKISATFFIFSLCGFSTQGDEGSQRTHLARDASRRVSAEASPSWILPSSFNSQINAILSKAATSGATAAVMDHGKVSAGITVPADSTVPHQSTHPHTFGLDRFQKFSRP